jgi:hypothetical protein
LATANQNKAAIDDFAATATAKHQDASSAHDEVQTALQEATALGEDLSALQAKRQEAGVAYTALNAANEAANAAYLQALGIFNGDLNTALALVETERRNTEIAFLATGTALTNAEQYQANEVQQAAYARSQTAFEIADEDYAEAQATKQSANVLLLESNSSVQTANDKRTQA